MRGSSSISSMHVHFWNGDEVRKPEHITTYGIQA